MIEGTTVVLLAAAALYRVLLSVTREPTIWRTTFTVCVLGVALGAALSSYGDRMDDALQVWNLAKLLLHLVLVVTAAATLIYVDTLRNPAHTPRVLIRPIVGAGVVAVVQVITWAAAPVHDQPVPDFTVIPHSLGIAFFNGSFVATILVATVITAQFCTRRALSRTDLTRSISLTLTGAACVGGSVVFTLYAVVVVVSYRDTGQGAAVKTVSDALLQPVLLVLALGTLALLIAPTVLQFAAAYATWRSLQPLWKDLVRRYPQIHLDATATGTPLRRLQTRVQRATVEIHDALRLIRVPLGLDADLDDLSRALREPLSTGYLSATEVLGRAQSQAAGPGMVVELAKAYSRNRP